TRPARNAAPGRGGRPALLRRGPRSTGEAEAGGPGRARWRLVRDPGGQGAPRRRGSLPARTEGAPRPARLGPPFAHRPHSRGGLRGPRGRSGWSVRPRVRPRSVREPDRADPGLAPARYTIPRSPTAAAPPMTATGLRFVRASTTVASAVSA